MAELEAEAVYPGDRYPDCQRNVFSSGLCTLQDVSMRKLWLVGRSEQGDSSQRDARSAVLLSFSRPTGVNISK